MNSLPSRPLILAALVIIGSGYIFLNSQVLAKFYVLLIMFIAFIVCLCLGFFLINSRVLIYTLCFSFLFSGVVCTYHFLKYEYGSYVLLKEYDNRKVTLTGKVKSIDRYENYSQVVFRIESIDGKKTDIPQNAIAYCYGEIDADENYGFVLDSKLNAIQNNSDFDTVTYLKSDKIFISLYPQNMEFIYGKPSFGQTIRDKVKECLEKNIKGKDNNATLIAEALITGEKTSLPSTLKKAFNRCGISHVLCVSGLHISIAIAFTMFVLGLLGVNVKTKCLVVYLVGIAYMLVASFTPSVCRAVIMVVTVYMGIFFRSRADSFNSLCGAAIILFAVSPYNLLDIGAQLSFMATLGIVFSSAVTSKIKYRFCRVHVLSEIVSSVVTSMFAIIFTLPVASVAFGEFSVISVVCNLLLVPFTSVILPLLLGTVVLAAVPGLRIFSVISGKITAYLIDLLCVCTEEFSGIAYSVFPSVKSVLLIISLGISVAFIAFIHGFSKKRIVLASAIPMFMIYLFINGLSLYGVVRNYSDVNIHYYRDDMSEAIAIKQKGNKYLYIPLGKEIVSEEDVFPIFGASGGVNYYYPIFDSGFNAQDLISMIENFEAERDIDYLCLNNNNPMHNRLYRYYQNTEKFQIINASDHFMFGDISVTTTSKNNLGYLEICYDSKVYAFLRSPGFDRGLLDQKEYKAFVYCPEKGVYSMDKLTGINSERLCAYYNLNEGHEGVENIKKLKFLKLE